MTHLDYILLVDYDSTATFLTERLLRRVTMASHVVTSITGQHALELLDQLTPPSPELLFLNLHLERGADMTGEQFLAEFHRRFPERQTVVALLALNSPEQVLARLQTTHSGPIYHKPLSEQEIRDLMQQYFPSSVPAYP